MDLGGVGKKEKICEGQGREKQWAVIDIHQKIHATSPHFKFHKTQNGNHQMFDYSVSFKLVRSCLVESLHQIIAQPFTEASEHLAWHQVHI